MAKRKKALGGANGLPQFLSIRDVASLLSIHRFHVVKLIEDGNFEGVIDLRSRGSSRACIRISTSAVREFIAQRKQIAASKAPKPPKRPSRPIKRKKRALGRP